MQCQVIRSEHHKRHRVYPNIEDNRRTECKISVARWQLPFASGQPSFGNQPIGFIPKGISVRNYSNQYLYLSTALNDPADNLLNFPELIVPPSCVYSAPFGLRSYDKEFAWNIPGSSYGNSALIMAYIYECEEFAGDEVYNLPSGLFPNAIESYEKGTITDMSPGGTIAAGATDTYPLLHASVDLTVAADTQPMRFTSGATASRLTNSFTLMPGEARSLGSRVGYVSVKNEGAAAGGYRILNLYQSQTL